MNCERFNRGQALVSTGRASPLTYRKNRIIVLSRPADELVHADVRCNVTDRSH